MKSAFNGDGAASHHFNWIVSKSGLKQGVANIDLLCVHIALVMKYHRTVICISTLSFGMQSMFTSKKRFRHAAPSSNRQQAANIEQPAVS